MEDKWLHWQWSTTAAGRLPCHCTDSDPQQQQADCPATWPHSAQPATKSKNNGTEMGDHQRFESWTSEVQEHWNYRVSDLIMFRLTEMGPQNNTEHVWEWQKLIYSNSRARTPTQRWFIYAFVFFSYEPCIQMATNALLHIKPCNEMRDNRHIWMAAAHKGGVM